MKRFFSSLKAYLKLYRAGFRISNSVMDSSLIRFEIYRFYWNDKVIREMPDIDMVGNHYNTIQNGHVEALSS